MSSLQTTHPRLPVKLSLSVVPQEPLEANGAWEMPKEKLISDTSLGD